MEFTAVTDPIYNPWGLTPNQIGIGWRLLRTSELGNDGYRICSRMSYPSDVLRNHSTEEAVRGYWGIPDDWCVAFTTHEAFRTQDPDPYCDPNSPEYTLYRIQQLTRNKIPPEVAGLCYTDPEKKITWTLVREAVYRQGWKHEDKQPLTHADWIAFFMEVGPKPQPPPKPQDTSEAFIVTRTMKQKRQLLWETLTDDELTQEVSIPVYIAEGGVQAIESYLTNEIGWAYCDRKQDRSPPVPGLRLVRNTEVENFGRESNSADALKAWLEAKVNAEAEPQSDSAAAPVSPVQALANSDDWILDSIADDLDEDDEDDDESSDEETDEDEY